MRIGDRTWRTIWPTDDRRGVAVIDQTQLPHRFETLCLDTLEAVADAISRMVVRGAPLIGVTGAFGLAIALAADPSESGLERAHRSLLATRPTAVNLAWALDRVRRHVGPLSPQARAEAAFHLAEDIAEEDVRTCRALADQGWSLIRDAHAAAGSTRPVNLLTHCNAGWLAAVDWGTALAPIYRAHDSGVPVHVWVDETRPRNQGASLTAWELGRHGVPHTVIADNAGGHLMQHGLVDLCIVGSDRTTASGDVCNKIGTYLKALAAHDNRVPFYAAVPSSTIDWTLGDGVRQIPIEQRDPSEVAEIAGLSADGRMTTVRLMPADSPAANYAFDVTPARLMTGIITEREIAPATRAGLRTLFPEQADAA